EGGIRDFHVTGVQTCALPISVQLARLRAGLDALLLQAQAHGAAEVGLVVALLDLAAAGTPLGDQADHRMRALAVVLGAVGTFQSSEARRAGRERESGRRSCH